TMRIGRSLTTLLAGLAIILSVAVLVQPAEAQQRRSFLERLFTPLHRRAEPPAPPPRAVKRRKAPAPARSRARRSAPAAAAAAPAPEPSVEKLANARTVLVIGDFTASGLAEGLPTAFDDAPGVRIIARTNGSAGLVRDDYYNWQAELPGLLDEIRPDIVTVMLGANDRQEFRRMPSSPPVLSDEWKREYERRVTALATTVAERRIPFLWVGQPSYGSARMASDMVALNDIYNRLATAAGGTFVDIWDGFVDENGAYITTGPDMNGQPARLRASDGINLTRAGRRKIAFYAEKPLRRLLGEAADPKVAALDPADAPRLDIGPARAPRVDRTPPISLEDPAGDDEVLLGAEIVIGTPEDAQVEEAGTVAPPPGRADYFRRR